MPRLRWVRTFAYGRPSPLRDAAFRRSHPAHAPGLAGRALVLSLGAYDYCLYLFWTRLPTVSRILMRAL